jgi:hypothetical protein
MKIKIERVPGQLITLAQIANVLITLFSRRPKSETEPMPPVQPVWHDQQEMKND